MKGLILAAGLGTRLRPLSLSRPKPLLPVANKYMISYIIEDLVKAGIKEIGLVVSSQKEIMMEKIGVEHLGANITYIFQPTLNGIGGAVKLCEKFVGNDSFLVYLGDNFIQAGVNEFVDRFNREKPDALLTLTKVENPRAFGVAVFNPDGSIKAVEEKPKEPKSDMAVTGIYLFNKKVFQAINNTKPSARGEFEIPDAITWMLNNGCKVVAGEIHGRWKDTGKPEDLLDANQLILDRMQMRVEGRVEGELHGKVGIGKGTFVERGSKIVGPALIGENCTIKAGAYIGPYSSIGNNVTLENANVENSIILNHNFINTNTKIKNSIIGENSRISPKETQETSKLIVGDYSQIEL